MSHQKQELGHPLSSPQNKAKGVIVILSSIPFFLAGFVGVYCALFCFLAGYDSWGAWVIGTAFLAGGGVFSLLGNFLRKAGLRIFRERIPL
jgi:hypothetical protein